MREEMTPASISPVMQIVNFPSFPFHVLIFLFLLGLVILPHVQGILRILALSTQLRMQSPPPEPVRPVYPAFGFA